MHKQFYFLSPVEVVKVTPQNMEEVAEWCGGKVAQVENKRKPGEMTKFVWVPTPKSSPMPNAYPGMYVTKRVVITVDNQLKTTFSVFRKDYIDKNYFDTPNLAVDATWERVAKEERAKNSAKPVPVAPKKKEPVVPIEKLMGEHGSQDATPEQVKGLTSVVAGPVDEVQTTDEKLQEAFETIESIIPGLQITANASDDGPVLDINYAREAAQVLEGIDKDVNKPTYEEVYDQVVDEVNQQLLEKTANELQALYTHGDITLEKFREIRDLKTLAESQRTSS